MRAGCREFECAPEIDAVALNAVVVRHETTIPEQPIGVSTGRPAQIFGLNRGPAISGSTALRVMMGSIQDAAWKKRRFGISRAARPLPARLGA
jgi:hypothetical protein